MDGGKWFGLLIALFVFTLPLASSQAEPPPQGGGVGISAFIEKFDTLGQMITETQNEIILARDQIIRANKNTVGLVVFAIILYSLLYSSVGYIIRRLVFIRRWGQVCKHQEKIESSIKAEMGNQLVLERERSRLLTRNLQKISSLGVSMDALDSRLKAIDERLAAKSQVVAVGPKDARPEPVRGGSKKKKKPRKWVGWLARRFWWFGGSR